MSKLRLIQCGVGGFGAHWLENYTSRSQDFELVALVDIVEETLRTAGDRVGIPPARQFSTLVEAVEQVDADAVLSVTPPSIHVEHARLAFEHGLHLMTEKPIADTVENARLMVELARLHNRQLVVSQNYRYRPPIQVLKRLLTERVVGELGHGHLDFYIAADFGGTFRESMDFPLLVDMAIHHLDLIRYSTGRNITRITAQSFRPPWSWFAHQPGLKMMMELEGGIPFSYSGDWTARGKATTWNGTWRLQFEEGSIHLEDDQVTIARSERWNRDLTVEEVALPDLPFTDQAATLHHFAQAIRTNEPAGISGVDNLYSFGAVMAAVVSAREGRAVDVREIVEG